MPRKHVRLPLALVIGASALSLARAHSVLALTATAEGVTSASFHVSTLVYALAALAALATAAMAWPRREQTAARNLIALLLAAGWWAGAITVESAVTSPSAKLLWSQIAYLGTTCVPLCYLLFAAALAGHDGLLSPARIGLMAIPPAITMALAATNGWHGWIWTGIRIDPDTNLATYLHGPAFALLVAYSYLYLALGLVLLARSLSETRNATRQQIVTILVATALPLAGNMLYIGPLNPIPGLDWTVPAFVAFALAIAWALLRMGLLDVAPIARAMLVDTMDAGILVLDQRGLIRDLNPAMERLLDAPRRELLGRNGAEALTRAPALTAMLAQGQVGSCHVVWPTGGGSRQYDVEVSPLASHRRASDARLVLFHDVTEHENMVSELRIAEASLHESEARYRGLVEHLGEGVAVLNLDDTFEFANAMAERIFGVAAGELEGRAFGEFVTPECRAIVPAETQNRQRGQASSYEAAIVRPDGQRRALLITATPHQDATGTFTGTQAIFRDITARRQEMELQARLNQLLLGLREAGDALATDLDVPALMDRLCQRLVDAQTYRAAWMMLLDRAGVVDYVAVAGPDYVRSTLRGYLGGPLPSCAQRVLEGKEPVIVHSPSDQGACACDVRLDAGSVRLAAPLSVGAIGYGVLCVAAPEAVLPEEQETTLFGELARDIAETIHNRALTLAQQRAERALQREQQRFQRMIEHASDLIAVIDAGGAITYVSPAVARILGAPPHDLISTNVLSYLVPDGNAPRRVAEMRARLLRGEALSLTFQHRDGRTVTLECTGQLQDPLDSPDTGAIVVNARDITERLEQQRTLERRDAILMATSHATARLLSGQDPTQTTVGALEAVGQATQAIAVSLYRLGPGRDGVTLYADWTRIDLSSYDHSRQRRSFAKLGDVGLLERVSAGETVIFAPDQVSPALGSCLHTIGATWGLLVPIHVDGS